VPCPITDEYVIRITLEALKVIESATLLVADGYPRYTIMITGQMPANIDPAVEAWAIL